MARRYTSKIVGKDAPKKRRYTSKVVKMAKGGMSKAEKAEVRALQQEQRSAVQAAKAEGASRADINAIKATNTAALNEAKTFLRQEGVQSLTNRQVAPVDGGPTVGVPSSTQTGMAGVDIANIPVVRMPETIPESMAGRGEPMPVGGLETIAPPAAPAPETRWRDLGMPEGATAKDIRKAEKQDRAELRSAQSSEIKMLESVLKEQGFTPQEIKKMVNAERKENTAERKEFVSAQKESGLQLWGQQFTRPATAEELTRHPDAVARNLTAADIQAAIDAGTLTPPQVRTGNNFSSVTSANINPEVVDTVLNRMDQGAQFLRDTKMPQLHKKTSGNATISTGLGLEQAYALSQAAADGTVTPDELVGDFFKQGGAERWTKRYDAIAPFMGDQPVAASEMADLKLKPVKNQENIFTAKLQGGGDNRMTGVFEYNPETNTYTNKSVIPTKVQVDDGGFLSSPLGALALGALSYFAAPAVAGMLGGSKVAAGAVLGGLRSALTGGDILKGALAGGVVPAVGDYVGGLESVQGLRNVLPSVSPYFDIPTALASGAANLVGAGIQSDFDPLSTLAGGAAGAVGGGIAGVPNIPRANANAAFSPNVQNALASGAANLTNSLIRSGGDINTALMSGAIGAAGSYLPTQIAGQLNAAGLTGRGTYPFASGLSNYMIGSALGDPNAINRGILSGAESYLAPVINKARESLYSGLMNQTQQQQPAYMTYNPFLQAR